MKKQLFAWVLPVCVALPAISNGAVTTLSGGMSVGYDFFERSYDVDRPDSYENDHSRLVISPFVAIVSEGPRHTVEFNYAPSYWYDVDESDDDLDHRLSLDYMRALTQKWGFTFADDFLLADEFNSYSPSIDEDTGGIVSESPGADVTTGDSLRDDRGRRTYYTNTLSLGTAYNYYEDSFISFDYVWSILRNDEDEAFGASYQDYDRHDLGVSLAHRISSRWLVSGGVGYILGTYDSVGDNATDVDDDDVDEYRANILAEYSYSPQQSVNAGYRFQESDFDSDFRRDTQIHDFTVGWRWAISQHKSFAVEAGPTYLDRDGESGEWNFNGNFSFENLFERGSFGIEGSAGTDFDNFSGTDERGVTEYWQFQADVRYTPIQYLTLSAYAAYRNEDRDEVAGTVPMTIVTVNTDRYSAGCGVSYQLHENYVASMNYGYVVYESDIAEDEYDDHRFVVALSYENDFFQW